MTHTSSKKEVPYIAHSEFSGNYYLVTKVKDNVPVDKTDITQQIESLVKSELSQALKELREEALNSGVVRIELPDNEGMLNTHIVTIEAIDNKIKALEEV